MSTTTAPAATTTSTFPEALHALLPRIRDRRAEIEEARARKDHFGMVKARNTAAKIWGPFYDAPPAD